MAELCQIENVIHFDCASTVLEVVYVFIGLHIFIWKTKTENLSFGKQLVCGDQCYIGGGTIYSKYEQGT